MLSARAGGFFFLENVRAEQASSAKVFVSLQLNCLLSAAALHAGITLFYGFHPPTRYPAVGAKLWVSNVPQVCISFISSCLASQQH